MARRSLPPPTFAHEPTEAQIEEYLQRVVHELLPTPTGQEKIFSVYGIVERPEKDDAVERINAPPMAGSVTLATSAWKVGETVVHEGTSWTVHTNQVISVWTFPSPGWGETWANVVILVPISQAMTEALPG
jgi:hypothetical protein